MGTDPKIKTSSKWAELDKKIEAGLKKTAEKLIAQQKQKNGYLIIADNTGTIKRVPASDL